MDRVSAASPARSGLPDCPNPSAPVPREAVLGREPPTIGLTDGAEGLN